MKSNPAILKKAYLYISRNDNTLKEKIEEIRDYAGSEARIDTDLKIFDGSDKSALEDFNSFVSAPSLFSSSKIAVLENIDRAGAVFQKLVLKILSEEDIEDGSEERNQPAVAYIFTASSEKINKSLLNIIRKIGTVRKLKSPVYGDLLKWLKDRTSSDGISFTDDAKVLLVENVNLDMGLLKNEYNKLFDYISSEDNKIIDRKAVKFLVSRVHSMKIFDLVDFIGERNKDKSLEALEDILKEDKKLLGLITLTHRMFKSLLYIKTEDGGASVTDYLSRNIYMPPYFIGKMVSKYIKFSRNYSEAEIVKIFKVLSGYDKDLRKGIADNSNIIKTMIIHIIDIKS
ncbi:MAG TPA: hypothetical protein DCP02_04235 [Actinobacteria bacterium]|nr:hypothetical protein [Actinomycetota bacterium]